MKSTLSCVAVVLFAAFANCVPVTQVERAVSSNVFTAASVTTTQIALPNGTTIQESCNVTAVTDLTTSDTVITSICAPANSSSSSSDGSNRQGLGISIISTGTISPSQLASALGNQDSASQSSTNSDQGVGASIVGQGTIPASQVGQSTLGTGATTLKRRTSVIATTNHVSTPEGSVVENCRIELIPDTNGEFTEVQNCELSLQPIGDTNSGNNGPASSSPFELSSSVAAAPSSIPGVVSASSSSSSSLSPSSSSSSSTSSSSASVSQAASSSPAAAPFVSPVTSVPVPLSPSPVADSSPVSAGAIIMGTSITSMDLASATATASAISAAEDNTTSAFTMPGRQISILPVGLAVFAGVSVIALIVVGVVTYERTKYRKNFRDRKLAEQMKAKPDMFSERSMV